MPGGYLIFGVMPLVLIFTDFHSPGEVIEAYPFLKTIGLAPMAGIVLFCIAAMKIKYYPAWTAVVFLIGTFVTFGVIATESPLLIANVANIIVSVALIKMAWQVTPEIKTA